MKKSSRMPRNSYVPADCVGTGPLWLKYQDARAAGKHGLSMPPPWRAFRSASVRSFPSSFPK